METPKCVDRRPRKSNVLNKNLRAARVASTLVHDAWIMSPCDNDRQNANDRQLRAVKRERRAVLWLVQLNDRIM